MKKLSLQARIIRYLRNHPNEWIAKEKIAELAKKATGRTGETTGRRLRIMAEVSLYGANMASQTYPEQKRALELLNGAKVEEKSFGKTRHKHYRYLPSQKTITDYRVEGGVAVAYQKTLIS